jgi:hypothetical protein
LARVRLLTHFRQALPSAFPAPLATTLLKVRSSHCGCQWHGSSRLCLTIYPYPQALPPAFPAQLARTPLKVAFLSELAVYGLLMFGLFSTLLLANTSKACAANVLARHGRLFRLPSLCRRHLFHIADGVVRNVRCWPLLSRRCQPAHTLPPWNALPGGCERACRMRGLQEGLLPGQVPDVEAVPQRAVLEVLAVR